MSIVVGTNSYLSLVEAEDYFEFRLHSDNWSSADEATKTAALIHGARVLDTYDYSGRKETQAQALSWPRSGVTDRDGYTVADVPTEIKHAQAELALSLLTTDRESDPSTAGFKEIKVGPINLKVDRYDRPEQLPDVVSGLLSHYLRGSGGVVGLIRA